MPILNSKRRRRLNVILIFILGFGLAIGLILYALKNSIDLYYTPQQIQGNQQIISKSIRLGGLVEKNSISKYDGLSLSFIVTDNIHRIKVQYNGILPDLFKEGQGVVVLGELKNDGEFVAKQVLAKHDEKYKPPGV